jgi:hypothetical protein
LPTSVSFSLSHTATSWFSIAFHHLLKYPKCYSSDSKCSYKIVEVGFFRLMIGLPVNL